jgi:hypothetical protein
VFFFLTKCPGFEGKTGNVPFFEKNNIMVTLS